MGRNHSWCSAEIYPKTFNFLTFSCVIYFYLLMTLILQIIQITLHPMKIHPVNLLKNFCNCNIQHVEKGRQKLNALTRIASCMDRRKGE